MTLNRSRRSGVKEWTFRYTTAIILIPFLKQQLCMEEQLKQGLTDSVLDDAGKEVAEAVREQTIANLNRSYQGAEELPEYVSDVQHIRDSSGRFTGTYTFEIRHPTAPLHENGGHIEPSYAQAKSVGWTRDGFYEALDDCNEWVEPKHPVRNAVLSVRGDFE